MIPSYAQVFQYQIPWKSSSVHFGDHQGTQRGLGFEYRGNVPLLDYPDARRMDIRQTLRDPYEQIQVKLFNQDNTTPIFALCDLSSSMQFRGRQRKLDQAREIAACVAYSAYQQGDVFSFIAYDDEVLPELTLPLSHHVHHSLEVIDSLGEHERMQVGSAGIMEVPQYLSQNRSLVFWISDFHMPLEQIEQALNMLSRHQVVPVVLWDEQEYQRLPRFGLGNMLDPETGRNRTILFREAVRARFVQAFADRKTALQHLFLKYESQPLFIGGEFSPLSLTHYFEQYMSL